MNSFSSLKGLALGLALAVGAMGFSGNAMADDDDGAGVALGIIGTVIGTAIEAEAAKEAAEEQDRRCQRFHRKCRHGEGWACEKYDNECSD
jgi:hypothetical protein